MDVTATPIKWNLSNVYMILCSPVCVKLRCTVLLLLLLEPFFGVTILIPGISFRVSPAHGLEPYGACNGLLASTLPADG